MVRVSLIEALPRDVRRYLASFLEPACLTSLCMTCSTFAALGRDETLFAKWFRRDFMLHIQENTSADVEKAMGITTTENRAQIEYPFKRAFASKGQIASLLSDLKTEPGCTWKRLFTALYCTKRGMLKEMRCCLGLTNYEAPIIHVLDFRTSYNGLGAPYIILFRGPADPSTLISCGSIVPLNLVESDSRYWTDDAAFAPDFTPHRNVVHMDGLDVFHKVFLFRKEQDHPAFYAYQGPPFGLELVCVFEGICYWNVASQKYQLVYPMCSLRRLYQHCRQQIARECEQLQNHIREQLACAAPIKFKVKADHTEVVKRNLAEVRSKLISSLEKDYDLKVNSVGVEMVRDVSLFSEKGIPVMTITLSCSPHVELDYKEGTCLGGCRKSLVEKGLDVDNRWRGLYCDDCIPVDDNEFAADVHQRTSWNRSDMCARYAARKLNVKKCLWISVNDTLDGVERMVQFKRVHLLEATVV
jgi:hypothetical protein